MFGWFKPKPAPEGPVEITLGTDVETSAEEFFARIDFASPRNYKRELGHRVEQTGEDRFLLVMSFMPDLEFHMVVEDNSPPTRYSYFMELPDGAGRLSWTRETYEIEPKDDHSCYARLRVTGEFESGLNMREYKHELEMLTLGCHNALGKVKVHAEGGIEQVREFERMQADSL